jgi:membrane-associated protease RseP (regulator of RpoE activity)
MTLLETTSLIISIIALYAIFVYIIHKKGLFEKYNISFYGPALLLRTKRGINILFKIAQYKRFWKGFGSFAIIFCFIMMIFMVALLALNTWLVVGFTPEQQAQLPGIEFGLVLPGINPILPLEYIAYILIALIVAIIVHEFSHGILTFAHGLKVKSLGLLYLILPLGAFCEPDEEQLKKTKTSNRMRVYAAGPMSNFCVAFIFILIFSYGFIGSVEPSEGIHVLYVIDDSPAELINLSRGMVITEFNNTEVNNVSSFITEIRNTSANQNVPITYLKNGEEYTSNVILADQSDFTNNLSDKNKSFLGIGFNYYVNGYIKALKNPFTYEFPDGLILVYSLPFFSYLAGYNPLVAPFTQGYVISGPLSFLPTDAFWIIANVLYWVFWLNLIVGFFNVLPMVPLDGGFLFSDALRTFLKKIKRNISEEKQDIIVKKITTFISIIILIVVLFPWIIKYF